MPLTNVLLDFLQPNTRYVVLQPVDNLSAGEELTFVRLSRGFDHFYVSDYFDVVFVEKSLRAYQSAGRAEPDEILTQPGDYLRRIGLGSGAEANEQRLAERLAQQRAEYVEQDRQRTLAEAQRRLEKHRRRSKR